MGGLGSIDPEASTLYLEDASADSCIVAKCKEALKYCVRAAEAGNVNGAISETSKAFRGAARGAPGVCPSVTGRLVQPAVRAEGGPPPRPGGSPNFVAALRPLH